MRHKSTRPSTLALTALALIAVGMASCGRKQREQRAAWRDQAEAQCLANRQVKLSSAISFRSSPIEGPGTCGMNKPLKVNAFSNGNVKLGSSATLACPIVVTADRWLEKTVQKVAMERLGTQIIEIKAGSYSCRAMNNGSGTRRTSEHAYGNALDVFAFRTSDGREISVKRGWNGSPEEQAFLREVFLGACDMFSTVLGPGADMFHYDHFHIDLAKHAGGRHICKPKFDYTPNPNLMPPQPDRGGWSSAQGPVSLPSAMPNSTLALSSTAPLSASRALPPGWNVGPSGRPLGQSQIASAPQPGGPLALPGSGYFQDEVVLGDLEGQGIIDQPGVDPLSSDSNAAELITPDKDPFAIKR